MATEIKELLTILADVIGKMPDTALYILGGFFIFKMTVLIAPSWGVYKIIQLSINKMHDAKTRPKEPVMNKVSLEDRFISADGTYRKFLTVLDAIKAHRRSKYKGAYFHNDDVVWINEAIQKQIQEDLKDVK